LMELFFAGPRQPLDHVRRKWGRRGLRLEARERRGAPIRCWGPPELV